MLKKLITIDGDVARVELGKIDANGIGRKINMAVLEFGFRSLKANKHPYMTITYEIWNSKHTDLIIDGNDIYTLFKFIDQKHEAYDLLTTVANYQKYHLMNDVNIPENDVKEIMKLVDNYRLNI